ncbi:metal-dependent hydrolase [Hydrogenophaga soli]
MATYLHFAPAVALAVAVGPRRVGWGLMGAGMFSALVPDLDVIGVTLGWGAYNGPYGHRGYTHSLGFALLVALLGALWPTRAGWRMRLGRALYLMACTASHPLLDGLIDVGVCNAWLWPLDGNRLCLDWRPIPMRGVPLFGSLRLKLELLWIGVPLLVLANLGMLLRHGAGAWWQARQSRQTRQPTPLALRLPDWWQDRLRPRERRRQRQAGIQALVAPWVRGRRAAMP